MLTVSRVCMSRIIINILALLISLPLIVINHLTMAKPGRVSFSDDTSTGISVRVSGDVRYPGVYTVAANSLTNSVIYMAGVYAPSICVAPAETAERIVVGGSDYNVAIQPDGTAIVTVGRMSASDMILLGIPLNINSLSQTDFERLPGVGAVMARRIIDYRQNNGGKMQVEDLQDIEGIGGMRYKILSEYF